MTTGMTIGKAAKAAGVGVETIRFYEREGIIAQPPKPPDAGRRCYPLELVGTIRFIREAQQLGFTLREVRELLALQSDPAGDCADVRAHAVAKLEAVQAKIAQLQRISAALEALIDSCPASGVLDLCTILGALAAPKARACDGRCASNSRSETSAQ